jgi:hypothetical protein
MQHVKAVFVGDPDCGKNAFLLSQFGINPETNPERFDNEYVTCLDYLLLNVQVSSTHY